jgi:hypothetical protein
LIPFNPNSLLEKLKYIKSFTSRSTTPQEQSNQPPSEFIVTPVILVQQGIHTMDLPIGKAQAAKE